MERKRKTLFALGCALLLGLSSCGEEEISKTHSSIEDTSTSISSSGPTSTSPVATPEEGEHAIEVKGSEGVTVRASEDFAAPGKAISLSVELSVGYELESLTINGEPLTLANHHAGFEMPDEDVLIEATARKASYLISVLSPVGIAISCEKDSAFYGEEITLTYEDGAYYRLSKLTVNGVEIEFSNGQASFPMPADNVLIEGESELTKGILDTPSNVKLEGTMLSFDPVDGATNGYAIRLNEDDSKIYLTSETTIDLANTPLYAMFENGENKIEVRAEGTDVDLLSRFSSPISYIFGVDESLLQDFLAKVNAIGEVTESSLSAIEAAKQAYLSLDEVTKLDSRAEQGKQTLDEKDGEYFIVLINKAKESLSEQDKQAAVSYYEDELLNKNSQKANEALQTAITSTCQTRVMYYESGLRLYVFANGINILGDSLLGGLPEVTGQDGKEASLSGVAGAKYIDGVLPGEAYSVSFGGTDYGTIAIPETMEGRCYGITFEGNAFGSNVTDDMGYDHFRVDVYLQSGVSGDLTLTSAPIATSTCETGNMGTLVQDINEELYKNGYAGKSLDLTFVFYPESEDGSKIGQVTIESIGDLHLDVMTELRLPKDREDQFYVFSSGDTAGRLNWMWETFQEGGNAYAEQIECMRVYVIDINGDEVGTFDLDFRKGDLYTYKEDIEAWLYENNLPEGDYSFTAKLIAKEGSEYSDSEYYKQTDYYHYVPREASR